MQAAAFFHLDSLHFVLCFMTGAIGYSVKVIFWPGLIVFNPKMTIFPL